MNYLTRLFPRNSQPITICRVYSDRKISKRDNSYFQAIFSLNRTAVNLVIESFTRIAALLDLQNITESSA